MILINKDNESPSTSSKNTELILGGSKVVFHGPIKIGTGGRILTYGTSIVEFGRNIMINNNTVIGSCSKIKIGNDVVIASECMIFDTDFHFICDMETRIVNNCCSPVEIGDGTWLTNRAAVLKGSILPNKCIVGANCVVKGDYHDQPQGTTFVSSITRIIDSKRCLVHSIENKLFDYYMDDPEMAYKITENIPELDTTT